MDSEDSATQTERAYDELADRAADLDADLDADVSPWGDSHFQTHYSWPAARTTLSAVDGDRVLLAGCGRGDHVSWFLDRDATVVGVDASPNAVESARDRYDTPDFERADLTDPLPFDDGAFDLVFSHLVLSHVAEWRPVLAEFRRVLGSGGRLVFATVHPAYLRAEKDVAPHDGVERVVVDWPGVEIPTYYRPEGRIVRALVDAGFRIEAFDEPDPDEAYAEHAPERYEQAMERPAVLCVRATPRD